MDTFTRAVEQEDGSVRAELADGTVRFVPAAETNHEYEVLMQLVARTAFRVEGALRCGLRPADITARAAQREAVLRAQAPAVEPESPR